MRSAPIQGGQRQASLWPVRVVVLLALASTLWLAGPRAYEVLAARFDPTPNSGPVVDLDLVGFGERPEWLRGPLLLAVARDLAPRLAEKVHIRDEDAVRGVKQRLLASPWVKAIRLREARPEGLRVSLDLRRPVIEVEAPGERLLVDRDGVCLPCPRRSSALPRTVLTGLPGYPAGDSRSSARLGLPHPDPMVRAAAAVAVEWRDEMVPLLPGAPPLVEVDASNLDHRFLGEARLSEVRVGLRRNDGKVVFLDYGRPPGARLERVPLATKAKVLRRILDQAPGLMGLEGGDLRFENRWRDWLLPRPNGPNGPGQPSRPPRKPALDKDK